ncbi:hypothetical protein GCM10011411_27130 [Aurantiacibacter arachoides]|nr:hypothetical protein GCM10011411_27130 [Aurantiacibacter arachoides]
MRNASGKWLLPLVASLALAACSQQATAPASEAPSAAAAAAAPANVHPISGLQVVPVTITTDTATHTFAAEVAASAEEQRRGLMFRTAMGPDEGMIFPYQAPQPLSFWMHNTVLPLDLVFIDADNRIINVGRGQPYDETSIASDRPGVAVLELNGGRAAELGIGPGDLVEW